MKEFKFKVECLEELIIVIKEIPGEDLNYQRALERARNKVAETGRKLHCITEIRKEESK